MADPQKSPPQIPVPKHREAKFPLKPDPKQKQSEPSTQEPDRRSLDSVASEEDGVQTAEEKWKELVDTLHLHRRHLLRIPGVTAVDVGYKLVGGKFTDDLALRVHVERKLPDDSLKTVFKDRPHDFFRRYNMELGPPGEDPAATWYLSPKGNPVLMDVIEAEYKPVQLTEPPRPRMILERPKRAEKVNRRSRLDPLVGGISIGSPQVPAGTLGALVWDNTNGSVCILSNWHVLSGNLHAEAGTPCFQPGRFDQGKSSDVVARLKRWSFDSQTDAAIAELTGSRHYCAGEIVSMFQQISGVTDPYLGMMVLKSGRSTGFTWGFIDGLFFSSAIEYSNGVVQIFEEQIHIAPADPNVRISESGDSGSVWVTETPDEGYRAVGLHFAGDLPHSSFGEYALANPMTIVADRLNFSFRPLFLEVRDEDVIAAPPPPTPPAAQIHFVNGGAQPVNIVLGGLTGSGNQPVDNQMGGGGTPQPNPGS
jgi:endonuclease G